jgi:hypothetical protein
MKYTLLEIAQEIASSMDSDEFNSINDSVESQQIAKVIKRAYFDIITRQKMPEHYTMFSLTASGDNTQPTVMFVPDDFESVEKVLYNKETATQTDMDFQEIKYVPLMEFLDRMYMLSESDTEVGTFNLSTQGGGLDVLYKNNEAPTSYTNIDDRTVLFNSYDSSVDTTLQASKSLAYGRRAITWSEGDVFIPDLDESQFPLLINEAKSLAWLELKQMPHQKAEQNARRQLLRSQTTKKRILGLSDLDKLPNFGRK